MTDLLVANKKPKSDIVILRNFFGQLPNTTISKFVAETKDLGAINVALLAKGIREESFNY